MTDEQVDRICAEIRDVFKALAFIAGVLLAGFVTISFN